MIKRESAMWICIWVWLFAIFTWADITTTRVALGLGGVEANPFAAMLLETDLFVPIKTLAIFVVFAVAIYIERKDPETGWCPACAAACVTFLPVASNLLGFAGVW